MQFTIYALLSLVAVAFAGPIALSERIDARSADPQVQAEAAAMSDASGNVVSFNSTSVYKAASAAGQ
ncbi:hypothetical protein B7494_g6141 [Chlorociboria aeruginascens]|nr:hypothetical protein B7494_g6141 [Chlorociboria aeruginascens]